MWCHAIVVLFAVWEHLACAYIEIKKQKIRRVGLKEIEYGTGTYTCVQNVSPTFRLHMHTQSNEYSTRFDVCEGFHQSSAMTLDSVKIHVQNETSPYQKLYLKTKTRRCSTPICNTTNQLCHLQNTWYSKQPFSIGCFKLDDSKSLHEKLLFHQTSIKIWLFGVPGRSQSFHERHTSLPTAPWYSIPSQSPPC